MKNTQDKHTRDVEERLIRECRGLSSVGTIQLLVREGLLSYPHIRAYLARRRVEEVVRKQRVGKMAAMEQVAEEMGCSFSTIRNYTYGAQ